MDYFAIFAIIKTFESLEYKEVSPTLLIFPDRLRTIEILP